nr:hypothetical protein [uncultured Agathobaculum sp.]
MRIHVAKKIPHLRVAKTKHLTAQHNADASLIDFVPCLPFLRADAGYQPVINPSVFSGRSWPTAARASRASCRSNACPDVSSGCIQCGSSLTSRAVSGPKIHYANPFDVTMQYGLSNITTFCSMKNTAGTFVPAVFCSSIYPARGLALPFPV